MPASGLFHPFFNYAWIAHIEQGGAIHSARVTLDRVPENGLHPLKVLLNIA